MGIPGSVNPLLLASQAGDYEVSRSVRFNSSDSAYLSRTPASAGNRKTWTWAGWVKRSIGSGNDELFSTDSSDGFVIRFVSSTSVIRIYSYSGGSFQLHLVTTPVYRDPSAWYHVVFAVDTTQATPSNRAKLYINGSEVTTFSTSTYPSQNTDLLANQAIAHFIGKNAWGVSGLNGYLADIHFIDGQALTPSDFTETDATTGQLIPKAYTGTYPGNSFHLPFSDNSTAAALGTDTSGNGNTWTVNNISVTAGAGNDSLVDTPSSTGVDTGNGGEVRGNYCTWNPLNKSSQVTLANGNLDYSASGANTNNGVLATIGISAGKWYWEYTCTSSTSGTSFAYLGIAGVNAAPSTLYGFAASNYIYQAVDGNKKNNDVSTAYGASWTSGDVIGVAFDADNGTLTFYKNGSTQGTAYSSIPAGTYTPSVSAYAAGTVSGVLNAGARPFAYTAPSGFKALCDTNLPAPVVAQPSTVMDVKLYTGNSSTQTISGLGFSPDLVWLKKRGGDAALRAHQLFDTIRGTNKALYSNLTDAEFTDTDALTAFNSDGFTLGAEAGINTLNDSLVAWTWDAGSSTVTNTQGSITSTVRANASAGFSIVTYTGNGSGNQTIGHGLGAAPALLITKARSTTGGWPVWHRSLAVNDYLDLQQTGAVNFGGSTQQLYGGADATFPSSTVYKIGTNGSVNANGTTYVCYCFAPVAGYSSFGSYVGNGSATDGPFVYTGFRPRWVLYKESSVAGSSWELIDAARNPYNASNARLFPDSSGAENTGQNALDLLSNGFKPRATYGGNNASGATYIWAAFAESPFQYARAR